MANFAFIYTPSDNWIGGKNYYISLFQELDKKLLNSGHKAFVFSDLNSSMSEIESLDQINIVRSRFLAPNGWCRILYRLSNKVFGLNSLLFLLLKFHNIHVLSHTYLPKWTKIKCLPWIPDFQHCYLKDNFSEKELSNRNKNAKLFFKNENVLFSSNSALKDADKFFDLSLTKPWVYRFVPRKVDEYDYDSYYKICTEHDITGPFVFLPNQFWKHKNHLLCFEALKHAKNEGITFKLICTGALSDYRNPNYKLEINKFISEHKLDGNIKLLGLVSRGVFNCLLKECEALINPSLFEGWSSTVEEGKSLKKKLILSDLPVHKEQAESINNVWFFDRYSSVSCYQAISNAMREEKQNVQVDDVEVDIGILEILSQIYSS